MELVRNESGSVVHLPTCKFTRYRPKEPWKWAEQFERVEPLLAQLDQLGLVDEVRPCSVCRPFNTPRELSDRLALEKISSVLSAAGSWSPETIETVAVIVKKTGRRAG